MSTVAAAPMETAQELANEQFRKSVDDMVDGAITDPHEIVAQSRAVGLSVAEIDDLVRKGQARHVALADIERAGELEQDQAALKSKQSELETKRQEVIQECNTKLAEIDGPLAEVQGQVLANQSQAHQLRQSGEGRLRDTTDPAIGERIRELFHQANPLVQSLRRDEASVEEMESEIEAFPTWRDGTFEKTARCVGVNDVRNLPRDCRFPSWHPRAGTFGTPRQLAPKELKYAEKRLNAMKAQLERLRASIASNRNSLEPIEAEKTRVEALRRDPRAFLATGLL